MTQAAPGVRPRLILPFPLSGKVPNEGNKTMPIGTVKFFNTAKGYGFIEPEEGGKDAFVHISAVEAAGLGTLQEGQKVSYELETGRNGKEAATNLAEA
jgi:CspA family cold shock protein